VEIRLVLVHLARDRTSDASVDVEGAVKGWQSGDICTWIEL
jgi:hypothetical protein